MMIVERKFVKTRFGYGEWIHHSMPLCHGVMGRLWDVPDSVVAIWVSIHTTPAAERVMAGVRVSDWSDGKDHKDVPELYLGGGIDYSDKLLDDHLKPYMGKKVWIEVRYEE